MSHNSKPYQNPDEKPQMVSAPSSARLSTYGAQEPVAAYAIPQQHSTMYATKTFSPYQLKVINLMSHVNDDKEMGEISDLLSNYFAQKAIAEADSLWDKGEINEASVAGWKQEHMRTCIALA